MSRAAQTTVRIALVLVAGATLVQGAPARAQDDAAPALGGYDGTAGASVLRAIYNPEGILPISAPVDLSAPDALATIATGPATFARASAADPGDILANPDALLSQGVDGYEPGTIPPYPYRVSAASGTGEPTSEVTPVPGITARAAADGSGSRAESTMPGLDAPAILTAGTARSTASTATDGTTVTIKSSSSISNINLLGLLTVGSVSTELVATSDGTTTETSGGTVITGASVLGQPITIDANGIRPAEGASTVESSTITAANEMLSALGIRVTVTSPVKQGKGGVGQLVSAGLRIDVEVSERTLPALGQILDTLPPFPPLAPGVPGIEDVLAVARARHLLTIGVGGASVNLSAQPAATFVPDDPPMVSVDLPSVDQGPPVLGGPVPSAPETRVATETPVSTGTREELPAGFAEGIGVAAVLGLLLQPLLADRLGRGAALVLEGDPTDHCPREGT